MAGGMFLLSLSFWASLAFADSPLLVRTIDAAGGDNTTRSSASFAEILKSAPPHLEWKTSIGQQLPAWLSQGQIPSSEEMEYFPTLPLESVPALQQAVYLRYSDGIPDSFAPAPDREVVFHLSKSCRPQETFSKVLVPSLGVHTRAEPLDFAVEPCFAQNSRSLSIALNALAESSRPLRITLLKEFEGFTYEITTSLELLQILQSFGMSAEIYLKRSLVDFLGATVTQGNSPAKDLRFPLWFSVSLGDQRIRVPAEHGDYGILFTRNGYERFAESRFFIGVPQTGQTGVSYWRPREHKSAEWTQGQIEFARHFGGNKISKAAPWLEAAAATMRSLRQTQHRGDLPNAAYGFWVCNDSSALALAKYSQLTGRGSRLSHLFPLVRVHSLIQADGSRLSIASDLATAMGLPPDFLDTFYPADTELAAQPEKLRQRLARAFPKSQAQRLQSCPETLRGFQQLVWK